MSSTCALNGSTAITIGSSTYYVTQASMAASPPIPAGAPGVDYTATTVALLTDGSNNPKGTMYLILELTGFYASFPAPPLPPLPIVTPTYTQAYIGFTLFLL
jgi:hypothetical protein